MIHYREDPNVNLPRRTDELAEPRELYVVDQPGYVFGEPSQGGEMWEWPTAAPQPTPTRRPIPWKWISVGGLPVAAVLAYLVYLNAALFAVVTALTVIAVCSGADKVRRCRNHD